MEAKKTEVQIGEDLYGISIDELEARILILKSEINRLEHELRKKKQERNAAENLFAPKS